MTKVVLYMSMSVDEFITSPDDGTDHELGVNGDRLHDWLRAGGVDWHSHRARRLPQRNRVRRAHGHR